MAPIPKQTTWTISFIQFSYNHALQKIKKADPLSNSACTASSRTCEKKKQATLQNAACFPQLTKQFVIISCCGPSMRDRLRPLCEIWRPKAALFYCSERRRHSQSIARR
jgi:hypothetical protein